MACPYFIPGEVHPRELWPRRHNLPLGDGFAGGCALRAGEACGEEALRAHCNLGYAPCNRLPSVRELDAVRLLCRRKGQTVHVALCGERDHRPVLTLELRYDAGGGRWMDAPEERFRAMADAAVRAFLARERQQ